MGPSVKFVSRINGSSLNKKIMGQLFFCKKDQTRGGEGVGKRPDCLRFFSGPLPLHWTLAALLVGNKGA